MAFCEKCETEIQDGMNVCPSCGATTQTQEQINDVEANKVMAVICYIGILILVPLISGKYKNSPFLKFHVNQSLVFLIGDIASMLLSLIPFVGPLIGGILSTGILVLQIICLITAVKGEMKPLPLIKEIKIIK